MGSRRQIIIFLVFVIGCVLLLSLIFGGGKKDGSSKKKDKQPEKTFNLLDYTDTNSKVINDVSGEINGNDEHREIKVTVTKSSRQIDIIQGYQGNIIKTKSYDNNEEAYQEFLSALAKTGFGTSRETKTTEDGACATGRRYSYSVINDNEVVSQTWSASCVKGSANVKSSTSVNTLFQNQITDFDTITSGVVL